MKPASTFLLLVALLSALFSGCKSFHSETPVKSSAALTRVADLQEALERAKSRVFPALVFIKPIIEDYESGEKTKHQVFGSGVIISSDGLVVTNDHVVEKAVRLHCVLSDKDQVEAEVLGRDPDTDLALLRLKDCDKKIPLPYAEFADSDNVSEGDFVMALGSPFGFKPLHLSGDHLQHPALPRLWRVTVPLQHLVTDGRGHQSR